MLMSQLKRSFIIIIIICDPLVIMAHLNNVCDTYLDYSLFNINNKHCRYNPDVNSNTADMVLRNGYPFESYNVTTKDGYILSLFRVPHDNKIKNCTRQPVFLLNGIQTTSEVWVDVRDRSLAFFLVERGYDVWLGNFRGSPHSRGHIKYTTSSSQYWDYSFHEIGIYDLPAFLDFIRKETKQEGNTIYIGHSLGTTASYVYATIHNKEAKDNIAGIISLSPIAFLPDVKSPIKYLAPYRNILAAISRLFHQYGIFTNYRLQRTIVSNTCDRSFLMPFCQFGFFSFVGFDYERIKPNEMPVIFSYAPNGGSVKTLLHYAQIVTSKGSKFQMYDYEKHNVDVYGTKTPPEYQVERITVPVHLIFGTRDFLGTKLSAEMLYESLDTTKSITGLDYNHGDFLNANDLKEYLYPILLNKMKHLGYNDCKIPDSKINT